MIKIKVIALGKLKEGYLRDACLEYTKRLSRYCDLSIEEITPQNLPDVPSAKEINAALSAEAEQIIRKIPPDYVLVTLCVEGKQKTSEKFAEFIGEYKNSGKNICFVIGSSYGLSDIIKQKSDIKLSLSEMTFPHQLFRIMLLEQIYRAFKINEGSTYHK